MALGTNYDRQGCFLARALEVVGERWTLLIVRDCFFGVRHFTDLREHLDISRAVLADRLDTLVAAGVLERRGQEYVLTAAGRELWPVVFHLSRWGERHVDGNHPPRLFLHAACETEVDDEGRCPACDRTPGVDELEIRLGPGPHPLRRSDRVARALEHPHRLLVALEP